MIDTISDMLTRIRNASKVNKAEVYIPFSKINLEIIKILKREGYVNDFEELKIEDKKFGGFNVILKYENNQPALTKLGRVSKPGRRVYAAKDNLPRILNGLGLAIISTSQGVMTNKQAKKVGLGGEVLCEVY